MLHILQWFVFTTIQLLHNLDLSTTSLWARSPGRSAGGAGKGRRSILQLHVCLWNLNSTSSSPVAPCRLSCQISANQREVETSTNVNKYWKTHTKDNDLVTNVIFANQQFSSTFWCRYSNSRDVVTSSPSFSHPATRVLWRACSQARVPPSLPDNKKQLITKAVHSWSSQ